MPDTGHRIAMMQSHTTQLSRSSHYPSPMSSRSSVVSKSTDLLRSVEPNVTGNHGSACSEITHGKFNPSSFIVTHNNSENRVLVSLNDEDEETGDVELSTVCRGMSSTSTDEQQLIEIDDDNEEDESTVRSSDSEDKSPRGVFARARRQSSILRYLPRNYPIIQPLVQLEKFDHMGVSLRQGKSVELTDGDFLRIQSIVLHSGNSSVTLRGHRLQRCSSMNGMLERKLNELCLFYEIDIDDPRPVLQQSVFEVSVLQIKKLRNIRWTNQKFPGDRNVKTTDYHNQEKVQNEGGLTVRWKYTVKYASSADRHRNNYQERTLERLTEEELYMPAVKLDALRRFEWRGDTIPGGAFQPHLVAENVVPSAMLRDESGIEVSKCTTDLMAPSVDARRSAGLVELYHRKRKRIVAHTEELRTGATKRMQHEEDKLNDTADGVKRIRLIENSLSGSNLPLIIDLDPEPPTADFQPFINMPSRLLSTPLPLPLSGSIRSQPRSTNTPRPRSDGQMLTYGDAFCGAGGSTRGAAMAGLQVKWGFDFSKHACATWRANFPKAVCYDMASHQFVQIAQRAARKGFPHVMKVDILHLSPPCQYFSFAHSTAGKDDEMNTASLFAVREVIGVAKPRIATLEQTFGITRPKFMGYLAALIQMFTSLDFSVRWAVVRLARWVNMFQENIACRPLTLF
jgi:DNA (cytosine-5)-methyltransferase 1